MPSGTAVSRCSKDAAKALPLQLLPSLVLSLHVGKMAPGALALVVLATQRGESTITQGRNLGEAYGGSAALGRSGCCAHLSQRGVPTHVNCADPPR